MWKPIFADQEIEVMKMIPQKRSTLWCHPFPVVEFVVKKFTKEKKRACHPPVSYVSTLSSSI